MGNANLKELQGLDISLNLKGGSHKLRGDAYAQRAAAWKSTGIVALRDAGLQVIPDPVFSLGTTVRSLDATGNKIEKLPSDGLALLVGLQRLMLSSNQLRSLPPSLGQLCSLKLLALDNNRLEHLPAQIGACTRLEQLTVSHNALVSLPDTLCSLKQLSILDVSHNQLRTLPSPLGSLQGLKDLQAQGNQMSSLPPSIEGLEELCTLNLDNNKLTELPPKILSGCCKLHSLSVEGNPLAPRYLEQMEGYQDYDERRKTKVDKQIAANVMLNR